MSQEVANSLSLKDHFPTTLFEWAAELTDLPDGSTKQMQLVSC